MRVLSLSSAVAAFALAVAPAVAGAASYGHGDTGVVDVSASPGYAEGEEPLSADPLDPSLLVAVANVFQANLPAPLDRVFGGGGFQDTRVYASQDGGAHWTTHKLDQGGLGTLTAPVPESEGFSPEFSDAFNVLNTDAASAWDRHGNAYFESGDVHGIHHGGDEVATVWRSTDAGRTWGPADGYAAVRVSEEGDELDRPWLATDTSGGPFDGTLYVTFETSPFVDDPPKVFVKRSSDQGRTWSATVRVDAGFYKTQFNPRQRPVVGADGTLYIVYVEAPPTVTPFAPQNAPIHLVVARSSDGGRSFERTEIDGDVHRVTSPDEAVEGYTEMIPAIATDPARPGRLAVAWPEATGADSSRIVLRWSADGGRSWSPRLDVTDDPAAKPDQHDRVTLAWLPGGALFAGWRDRRCCGGTFDDRYQQWVRALEPGRSGALVPGRTLEFSDGSQLGNTADGRAQLQPDEFQGLVATAQGVGLTWSQLTGTYTDLMFRRVPLRAFGLGHSSAARARPLRPRRPSARPR